MAKDLTKYRIQGTDKFLPKSRTVLACLTQFFKDVNVTKHPNTSWPDEIQGNAGLIKKMEDVENPRYYFMDEVLTDSQGNKYVVCNQWGAGNFERFISHAAKMGYPLEPNTNDGKGAQVDNEVQDNTITDNNNSSATVAGSPGWGAAEAIAFILRQLVLADGNIQQEEVNAMHFAFLEFSKQEIDVKSSFESVDVLGKMYEGLGLSEGVFNNCLNFINENCSHDVKSTLLNMLLEISAQDGIAVKNEFHYLKLVVNTFFPGNEEQLLLRFKDAGISIEGENQVAVPDEQMLEITIMGSMCQVYKCAKLEEQSLDEIDNHFDNVIDYFFRFDADNWICIEINGQKIINGEISGLGISCGDLCCAIDYEEPEEIEGQINNLTKIQGFQNIDTDEIQVSEVNKLMVVDQGPLDFGLNDHRAPFYENRYTMYEEGKYVIKTRPIKVQNFQITDLFFQKEHCLDDLVRTGGDYCFSKIFHIELGELEFEIDESNVKDTDVLKGWAIDF